MLDLTVGFCIDGFPVVRVDQTEASIVPVLVVVATLLVTECACAQRERPDRQADRGRLIDNREK